MTSEYNIEEFKGKLNELTKNGYALIKGNPFAIFSINFSDKPFYGNIYESEFKITRNANLNLVPYVIIGNFKKSGKQTAVKYEVKPMKFGYYWIRFFPILINIVGIVALLLNLKNIDKNIFNTKFFVIIFIVELFLLFPILHTEMKKRKFEKEFLNKLKINNNYR